MSEGITDRWVMPNGHLFYSPLGLFGFQAEAVATAFYTPGLVGVLDTGLGKTVVSMALAAELFEADAVDLVMHIARRNKIARTEFPADWAQFTSLRVAVYHGTGREKRLARDGVPDVLLTTYETGRADLMRRVRKPGQRGKGSRTDGPLVEALGLRSKRVLWLFDEVARLGNRGSELYQSYEYLLTQLRRGPHAQRVLGLSATPMSVDYEQPFNIGRVVAPTRMPTVAVFEERCTRGRDDYGRYLYKAGAREWFATAFQPLIYRKRYTDPDVASVMPKLVERLLVVTLEPEHASLYKGVSELYGSEVSELTLEQEQKLNMALRLTAAHPAAHLHSDSQLSKTIVAAMGEAGLRAIMSSKSQRLVEELTTLVTGQGAQVLVFTFYARTVLPELARDLREAGFSVATYTGDQSVAENAQALAAFGSGVAQVLLSSDAGSEGLNLPQAHYIIEYESARTFAGRTQRFGRGTRITSGAGFVHGVTMVAEKTIEVGTVRAVVDRNKWQDRLHGDVGAIGHVHAGARRALLQVDS
jgi:superfamily II DNA or RNA helicase